jgi:sugar lactone lactonase YvrE
LYVADTGNNRVLRFNGGVAGNADVLASYGSATNQVNSPRGLVINTSSTLFVADITNNRIVSIANANSGTGGTRTIIASFGTGLNPGQVRTPEGVGVDNNGNLYVADTGNNRVLMFPGGAPGAATQIAGSGNGLGQVNKPEGVTVSAFTTGSLSGGSSIIMSDVTYHRIQGRLVSSSTWIQLGGFGGGIGQFNQPSKVR